MTSTSTIPSSSPRARGGSSKLDIASNIFQQAKDNVDIVPVPFLKGAVSIVSSILVMMQNMRANKEERESIRILCDNLEVALKVLQDPCQENLTSPTFNQSLQIFESAMKSAEERLKTIAEQSRLKRILCSNSNKDLLIQTRSDIRDSTLTLLLSSSLQTHSTKQISRGAVKEFGREDIELFELPRGSFPPGVIGARIRRAGNSPEELVMKKYQDKQKVGAFS
ncbi:hypothetical protein K439DRAFT_954238 [Ramaria rubella]|nr:hypothetical protein K439DRAFT_954238 [Ramaria rubella]